MVTSKDYWTKRMDGIFDKLDKKEVKLNDELMKYYQDALTDTAKITGSIMKKPLNRSGAPI